MTMTPTCMTSERIGSLTWHDHDVHTLLVSVDVRPWSIATGSHVTHSIDLARQRRRQVREYHHQLTRHTPRCLSPSYMPASRRTIMSSHHRKVSVLRCLPVTVKSHQGATLKGVWDREEATLEIQKLPLAIIKQFRILYIFVV